MRVVLRACGSLLVAVLAGGPFVAAPVQVRVSADPSADGTRVVLSHDRPVSYVVRVERERIEIAYSEAVAVDPAERRYSGDPVLSRHDARGERTLVLFLGPGYRSHETFELKNPFRLVVDLAGSGDEASQPPAQTSKRSATTAIVVLDPGHGGAETGAIGPTGLEEKEVTLDIARRLKQELQRAAKVSVVLTRDEDRLVGLDERTSIANHNRATLFVSIHLNASRRTGATGAETYYLASDASDDEARTAAALENRAHGVDEGALSPGEGGDDLELILWDLAQNQYLAESSRLAERIQTQLNELAGTRDRGVKQAPFRVLMGATMPAVLVEVGFVSSPEEETRFKSGDYRDQLVRAMARAVSEFVADVARRSEPARRTGADGR